MLPLRETLYEIFAGSIHPPFCPVVGAAFKEKCKTDRIDYNEAFETFIDLYLSNQIEFRRSVVVNINK